MNPPCLFPLSICLLASNFISKSKQLIFFFFHFFILFNIFNSTQVSYRNFILFDFSAIIVTDLTKYRSCH